MISRVRTLLAQRFAVKWRLWQWYATLVPRVLYGVRVRVEAQGRPQLHGWPRIVAPARSHGGSLELSIGRDVWFGSSRFVVAGGTSSITLGDQSDFADGVTFWVSGGSVTIGDRAHVREGAAMRAYGELTIGRRAVLSYFCVLHCGHRVTLGDDVVFAERSTIADGDHTADDEAICRAPVRSEAVEIDDNVLVSAGAVIARGVRLASKTIVAANSVVTAKQEWPSGVLIGGVPAVVLRQL